MLKSQKGPLKSETPAQNAGNCTGVSGVFVCLFTLFSGRGDQAVDNTTHHFFNLTFTDLYTRYQ